MRLQQRPRLHTSPDGEVDQHDERANGVVGHDRRQAEDRSKHEISVAGLRFNRVSPEQNVGDVKRTAG